MKIYAVTDTHDATTPAEKADILGDGKDDNELISGSSRLSLTDLIDSGYSPSKGIIPSASRAEKLAASQMIQSTYKFNGPPGPSPSKSSPGLFKFRRRAASAGGDNHNLTSLDDAQAQLLKKSVDGHYDEVILGKRELIHDTAYERVQLRHPGFFRYNSETVAQSIF